MKKIRKGILEDDLLEAVIGLPSSLFYGTGIPAALLIINKNKSEDKKNKVLYKIQNLNTKKGKTKINLEKKILKKFIYI